MHPDLIWLLGWACLAPAGAIAAHSLVADLRRARPVIAAAARALFFPAVSVAPRATALQPAAVEARRRPASRVR